MALSDDTLLNRIAYGHYLVKELGAKLYKKYCFGIPCEKLEIKLLKATFYLEEMELYYKGCSCIDEDDICEMIAELVKITT